MTELLKWMAGAVLVAAGTISAGYGAGIMWRAWRATTPPAVMTRFQWGEDQQPGGYVLFLSGDVPEDTVRANYLAPTSLPLHSRKVLPMPKSGDAAPQ